MSASKTLERLREGLRAEARKRHGQIGALEADAAFTRGRLSDLYSGRKTIKLEVFLEALDALEVDHADFFARTLGGSMRPEACLEQFEVAADRDSAWTRIERATRELAASEPPTVEPLAAASVDAVTEVAACTVYNQQRRLRHTAKYRTVSFARAYLEHLDAWRYDHAEEAAKLVTTVAVDLVPRLPGSAAERLSLQCFALGVFGSARRLKGKFTAASRAFRLALELVREYRLREDIAKLLQRASYLMKDFGHFEHALVCLREALEIFVDLGSDVGIGKVLVDRAMMWWYLGDYEAVVLILRRALRCLEGTEAELPRYHLSTYQYLAFAHEQLGELEAAERYLEQGARIFAPNHEVDAVRLRWLQGSLAFQRGALATSEELLRDVHEVLARKENPLQEAIVTADLLRTLLARGKAAEATERALAMARLVTDIKKNRLADAAIVGLITAAFEGRLTQETVREARAKLRAARVPERCACL